MSDMTHIPYSPPYTQIKIIDYIPNQKLIVEINQQRKEVDLSWAFHDRSADLRIINEKLKQLLK